MVRRRLAIFDFSSFFSFDHPDPYSQLEIVFLAFQSLNPVKDSDPLRPFSFHHRSLMMTTRFRYQKDKVSSRGKSLCKFVQSQKISCFSSALTRKRLVVGFLEGPWVMKF